MPLLDYLPIIGTIRSRKLIESLTAYQIELEEDIKDWQALNKQAAEKDLDWRDYEKNHKDCWEAYVENPLAKGYVDRLVDFVVKGGFDIVSEDEPTQEALDRYKKEIDWLGFQTQACREVTIYGEIFNRFFDNGLTSTSRLTDPVTVKAIETNPEDVAEVVKYHLNYQMTTYDDEGNVTGSTVRKESVEADEMIHLKVNTVSTATRGISDLLCVLKWLTRHKIVCTNMVRRTNIQSSIIGEKILNSPGASSTTTGGWKDAGDDATSALTGKRKERTPQPGTWHVHSKNVEYKFTELKGDARGMIDLLKYLNKVICAGFGLSEHWLGDTSESNLATATSLELPIMAKFERRQNELKIFFEDHLRKVLESEGIENAKFDVIPPELSPEDAVQFANAMKTLCDGLLVAVGAGWVSNETAAKTVGEYLDYFESYETEQEKQKEREEAKVREEPAPPVLPVPPIQPVELPQEAVDHLAGQLKEVETKFSKTAMDELIKDYAKALVATFNRNKSKVMKAVKSEE